MQLHLNRVAIILLCLAIMNSSAQAAGASKAEKPIGVLLAAGDIAKCKTAKGRILDKGKAAATAKLIRRVISKTRRAGIPVKVLALGDLAYDSGTARDFKCFESSWGAFAGLILPVPGNHEYDSPNPDAAPYFDFFKKHQSDFVTRSSGYYSIRFPDLHSGPWQLIGLNAYLPEAESFKQQEWLENELQTSNAPCVLAFMHPPLMSSAHHGHGNSTDVTADLCRPGASTTGCRGLNRMNVAYRALYESGASVVLAGHEHIFEQFGRHDATGNPAKDGFRSFVVGTGGGSLYRKEYAQRWPSEVLSQQSYGVLRINLFRDRYTWSFLATDKDKPVTIPPDRDKDRCNLRR